MQNLQTYLPYGDFNATASVLDRDRLGKQRSQTFQIMTALMTGTGWVSHPATLMWRRYESALLEYQRAICAEWADRGYKDDLYAKTEELYLRNRKWDDEYTEPYWLHSEPFHLSHQSNLLRQDRVYYAQYFPGIPDWANYVWPAPIDDNNPPSVIPWWTPYVGTI